MGRPVHTRSIKKMAGRLFSRVALSEAAGVHTRRAQTTEARCALFLLAEGKLPFTGQCTVLYSFPAAGLQSPLPWLFSPWHVVSRLKQRWNCKANAAFSSRT